VQRLLFVVILAVILIVLPLLVSSDTAISSGDGDADIPENGVTISINTTGNSSASAYYYNDWST